jgi:hypothetical protein
MLAHQPDAQHQGGHHPDLMQIEIARSLISAQLILISINIGRVTRLRNVKKLGDAFGQQRAVALAFSEIENGN